MTWDWKYAWSVMPDLLHGLLVTVEVALLASVVAAVLGLLWALVCRSRFVVVSLPVRSVLEFIRGTPLLVQIFFAYYVLPDYGLVLSAFIIGVLVLGVHYSTYAAEAYRAGIEAVPRGQWEAARALHLSPAHTWRAVIWPLALRRALPPLGSYLVAMYKETALLFTIGLPVLLAEAQIQGNAHFRLLEPLTIAGLLYMVISYPSSRLVRNLEKTHVN
jgi:polar amino acid transport system permease protein